MYLKRHTHMRRGSIFFFFFDSFIQKVARCIAIDICPPLLSTGAPTTFFYFFLTVRPSSKRPWSFPLYLAVETAFLVASGFIGT
jgi:hypothetical protein